jgi:hypothetical protein
MMPALAVNPTPKPTTIVGPVSRFLGKLNPVEALERSRTGSLS